MILGKKVRLYPTKGQEQKIMAICRNSQIHIQLTLARQEENYKNGGKFISDNDLRKELTILKQSELSWLNEVSNNVAKQAVKDACRAYLNFFKKTADKPRFKSRRIARSLFIMIALS